MKQLALPTLCDFAHSGKTTRKVLWQSNVLQFYLKLLQDIYWQIPALEAVLVWLQDDTARVEAVLLRSDSIAQLSSCFLTASSASLENVLEGLVKISKISGSVAARLSQRDDLTDRIEQQLHHKKAVVRLNELRLLRAMCDADHGLIFKKDSLFKVSTQARV